MKESLLKQTLMEQGLRYDGQLTMKKSNIVMKIILPLEEFTCRRRVLVLPNRFTLALWS